MGHRGRRISPTRPGEYANAGDPWPRLCRRGEGPSGRRPVPYRMLLGFRGEAPSTALRDVRAAQPRLDAFRLLLRLAQVRNMRQIRLLDPSARSNSYPRPPPRPEAEDTG